VLPLDDPSASRPASPALDPTPPALQVAVQQEPAQEARPVAFVLTDDEKGVVKLHPAFRGTIMNGASTPRTVRVGKRVLHLEVAQRLVVE
jgi:hypothetical protein